MLESLLETSRLLGLLGLSLIIVEVAVFGFSTLFLLFIGLGLVGTAFLIAIDVLPARDMSAALAVAVQSSLWAAVLWKPLKNLQHRQQSPNNQPSNVPTIEFVLQSDVTATQFGEHDYSGVRWTVKLANNARPLAKGTLVRVIKEEVGVLIVSPLSVAEKDIKQR